MFHWTRVPDELFSKYRVYLTVMKDDVERNNVMPNTLARRFNAVSQSIFRNKIFSISLYSMTWLLVTSAILNKTYFCLTFIWMDVPNWSETSEPAYPLLVTGCPLDTYAYFKFGPMHSNIRFLLVAYWTIKWPWPQKFMHNSWNWALPAVLVIFIWTTCTMTSSNNKGDLSCRRI